MKQRLSKLQKWILTTCLEAPNKAIDGRYIMVAFFKKRTPTNEASLSRSIWSLIDKGFVSGLSPIPIETMAMLYGMGHKSEKEFNEDYKDVLASSRKEKVAITTIKGFNKVKIIVLTDEGEAKVRELLKVK